MGEKMMLMIDFLMILDVIFGKILSVRYLGTMIRSNLCVN